MCIRDRHNVWRTKGLIFSSKVLLALVNTGITREEAYVIVQRNAMAVWEDIQNAVDGPTYRERLEKDVYKRQGHRGGGQPGHRRRARRVQRSIATE